VAELCGVSVCMERCTLGRLQRRQSTRLNYCCWHFTGRLQYTQFINRPRRFVYHKHHHHHHHHQLVINVGIIQKYVERKRKVQNSSSLKQAPRHYEYIRYISTFYDTIRYDTIGEFNVDSKAEYSALSSTRRQKKKLKQTTPVPL